MRQTKCFQQVGYTVNVSHLFFANYIFSNLCITLGISYIFVILFEVPLVHMEKLLFAGLGMAKMPDVPEYRKLQEKAKTKMGNDENQPAKD